MTRHTSSPGQYVAELDPGIDDDAMLCRANQSGALPVTADRDFGELVFRLGRIHAGVVLVRLAGLSSEAKAETASRVFATRRDELLSVFSVISPGRVRIRRPVIESQGGLPAAATRPTARHLPSCSTTDPAARSGTYPDPRQFVSRRWLPRPPLQSSTAGLSWVAEP